ncbi:2-hydroxyacyl-CoA dehydratase family protein [Bradyrhizobium jicamae]|nr:2-hydroxyacyl-CoA dehydratase family protein [Bradyrhizobium jicamae]
MRTERREGERAAQYQNLLGLMGEPHGDRAAAPDALIKAIRMRSVMNCHRLAEAYRETSKVAYVSEQFPTEVVFAAGAMPWNIESMAIMLAQSVDVNRIFQLTQEKGLSRDICSFLRGPHGMMLANCYPTPDVVLTNDQPCEGLAKQMCLAGKRFDVPVIAMNTPESFDEDAIGYVARQIERMRERMAAELGLEGSSESLQRAVAFSNDAREYYRKTVALLETHKLPGISRELQEIFGMNYFGARENVTLCKALYQAAAELAKAAPGGGKRVIWIGQVPEETHELLRHMSREVEILYWAPLWNANLRSLDETRSLHSIAERAILYHWNAERMSVELERICDRFSVEGFVIVNVWGCRNIAGISPMLRDFAARRKIKHITINVDLVDRNNYAFNHVKNRVDAFLELMQ